MKKSSSYYTFVFLLSLKGRPFGWLFSISSIFVFFASFIVHTVLEPSAGKGDIVDYIVKHGNRTRDNYKYDKDLDIDCIEPDNNLQHILKGKGYRLVHNDFLSFTTYKQYDLVVMNPPFSNEDKHLLKALELQKNGGNIICILNAETIRNPFSNTRKLLMEKLEEYQANIFFLSGEFEQAERRTSVEIAVVKVAIPSQKRESRIFTELKQKHYADNSIEDSTELSVNDFVKATVKRYEVEVEAGIQLIQEYRAMKPYILSSVKEERYSKPLIEIRVKGHTDFTINDYVKQVRKKYWTTLFEDERFVKGMTSNFREDYRSKVQKLSEYDFSLFNIYSIQLDMSKHMVRGIEECIIKLFDELTHQYSYNEYSKNTHYFNGWTTNKCWIINKKVVLPFFKAWNFLDKFSPTDIYIEQKLADMEKALDYLNGSVSDTTILYGRLREAELMGRTKKIPLKYFTVTFFKKGTCHIEFTNLELLKKLNIFGAQNKHWLPPSYGKKTYQEMNPEEQQVIDDFEGKESYEYVMENKEKFLCELSTDTFLIGAKEIA